ncbi:MAG: ABC transporter substrate binding protein [Leptospira sp.]|nr:ABC transporter substrate binding protein [Leptospira sp.]
MKVLGRNLIIFFWGYLFTFSIFPDSIKIKVLLTSDNSIYEQALFGLQSSFEGDLDIFYLDELEADESKLQNFYRDLDKSNSFVITIGKGATHAIQENTKNIPILFSMVSNPKSLNLKSNRFCGVSMDVPIELFFSTLKDINLNAKTVLSIYSNSEGEYISETGEHTDLKYNLIFTKQKTNREKLTSFLDDLTQKPDAIFIPPDPLYDSSNFDFISLYSQKNSIILMSSFPAFVRSGVTFGISPDYTNIGIETGNLANKLKIGKLSCSNAGFLFPNQFNFLLNEEYAEKSKIPIPNSLIERAKKSKLFSAAVKLLNEEKWKSAKSIFENLLATDPSNKSLLYYHQIALQKISGSQTNEILIKAKSYFDSGNFLQSRIEYQKALSLNPNLIIAKEGIQKSITSQSEKEFSLGLISKKNGNIFEALQYFVGSLRTNPQNSNAKSELENTRRTEYFRIPELKTGGIDDYQKRNYDSAILKFEKILFIDPNDKSAQEYLRLSKLKKEAILNIQKKQKQ